MRESETYMAILEEGEEKGGIKELKKMILRLGQKRFGIPGEGVKTELTAISDLERLERLLECTPDAKSWPELLATP